jgi:hypothetical protein
MRGPVRVGSHRETGLRLVYDAIGFFFWGPQKGGYRDYQSDGL